MTYEYLSDARLAIREFDGANAKGQPIRLTLVPSAPPRAATSRNPFDTAQKPGRSLFERIEAPPSRSRDRSASPGRPRPTDTSKPPPDGIDRYVPNHRSGPRSPRREGGRRPGARREDSGRGVRGRGGDRTDRRGGANGRPRKTQEELDAEMEDYWGGNKQDGNGGGAGAPATQNGDAATGVGGGSGGGDEDIEMIE